MHTTRESGPSISIRRHLGKLLYPTPAWNAESVQAREVMGALMTGPRIEKQVVLASLEDAEGFRCVDIVRLPDGMFVFKEFRRDPEDSGRWTLVADYSHMK